MLISTALLLDSNIRNSVCTPAKLPCRRVEVGYDILLSLRPWGVAARPAILENRGAKSHFCDYFIIRPRYRRYKEIKKSKTVNFYCIVDYAHRGHYVKKNSPYCSTSVVVWKRIKSTKITFSIIT
jgi:hypothetical protein